MLRSFRVELTKLFHWPAFWALLMVWGALALVFGYVTQYLAYLTPAAGVTEAQRQASLAAMLPSGIVGKVVPGYPLFGGVIALALGALITGSEFGWGTWTTILLQEPARLRVALGKLAALFVGVGCQVLVGFAAAATASVVVAILQGHAITAPPMGDLLTGLGVAWLILMAWASIGAALATILRSSALPIGIGFAYLLVERLLASLSGGSDVIAGVARVLPGTNAGSLASSVLPPGFAISAPGMNNLVAGPLAATVLGIYIVAMSVVTCAVIAWRDVR
jgi:ABC-2 type transport system permease protein